MSPPLIILAAGGISPPPGAPASRSAACIESSSATNPHPESYSCSSRPAVATAEARAPVTKTTLAQIQRTYRAEKRDVGVTAIPRQSPRSYAMEQWFKNDQKPARYDSYLAKIVPKGPYTYELSPNSGILECRMFRFFTSQEKNTGATAKVRAWKEFEIQKLCSTGQQSAALDAMKWLGGEGWSLG